MFRRRARERRPLFPAALAALADPALLEALAFARSRARPVTAAEFAEATGVHRNVAAARLDRLVDGGLLGTGRERRTGRSGPGAGRPAKIYSVLPELEALAFPPRRYELLLGLVLDELPTSGRADRLHRIGTAFGRELAAAAELTPDPSFREGLERVCRAVGSLGYQASVAEAAAHEAVIATPTCPLRPLVVARREAAAIDHGMWAALVAAATRGLDTESVVCETADCLREHSSCRIAIRLRAMSSGGPPGTPG